MKFLIAQIFWEIYDYLHLQTKRKTKIFRKKDNNTATLYRSHAPTTLYKKAQKSTKYFCAEYCVDCGLMFHFSLFRFTSKIITSFSLCFVMRMFIYLPHRTYLCTGCHWNTFIATTTLQQHGGMWIGTEQYETQNFLLLSI